jgi:hypothetical protein
MSEKKSSPIRRVAIAVRNAGCGREERSLKRVLKQDRQVKLTRPEQPGQAPFSAYSGMGAWIPVEDDLVNGRMIVKEFRDGRFGQQNEMRLRKPLPQRHERGRYHDAIAQPIRRPD